MVPLPMFFFIQQVVVKSLDDNRHVGAASGFLYMGADPEHLHTSPWFLLAAVISVVPFLISLLLYKILKARWTF